MTFRASAADLPCVILFPILLTTPTAKAVGVLLPINAG